MTTAIACAAPAEPELAVVDLSRKSSPSLAEALRKASDLEALGAKKTKRAVEDAASLGLRCGTGDIECLEKLLVLLRVKRLLAFAIRGEVVAVTLVGDGPARQARVQMSRKVSNATIAREAWFELTAPPKQDDEVEHVEPPEDELEKERADVPDVTPTATSEGLSTGVVLGVGGAAGTLLFGAGTIAVSAELARQLEGTRRNPPVPVDAKSYRTLEVAFWTLSVCTVAAAATGVVGIGLSLSEP